MTIDTAIEMIDASLAAMSPYKGTDTAIREAMEGLEPLRNDLGELGNRVGGWTEFSSLTSMMEFAGGIVFLKTSKS